MNKSLSFLITTCLMLSPPVYGASSQDLPELGDASSSLISPEMERQIGGDFLKQVHAALPTVSDPILKYYVSSHISELGQHSQLREKVLSTVLIDSEDINAFAAPGGVVGINLGLMLYAEDEHEYSSVVAHELAHLSQRHFARGIEEQRSQSLPTIAALIAAIMIGAAGGGDAGIAAIATAQAAAQAKQMRYSRGREQEADRVGLNTIAAAGLDPAGMGRMFERMQRASRFSRRPPEFLLTHPLSETRISDAKSQARNYPDKNYEDPLDYQLMRARAQIHYTKSDKEAVKIFSKKLANQPDSLAAEYGLGLAHSRNGDHNMAIAMGDKLYTSNPQKILYISSYAEILIEANKLDQAIKLLAHQLVINPDNEPMTLLYARALAEDKEYEQAEAVLERHSRKNPLNVDVWYDLAETAGLAGNIVGVHLARAEYFQLHGSFQKALQHLEYARRLVNRSNTQLVAKLDQRIIDLRTEIRARS